jgi:diguanylate cyclase (GGDEF)-like protein
MRFSATTKSDDINALGPDAQSINLISMISSHLDTDAVCRSFWKTHTRRWTRQSRGNVRNPERARLLRRIRELEAENSRLMQLAVTDELTGACNRRHFNDQLTRASSLVARGRSLAFCLFDVDNFKAYNDEYGHAAGDEALRLIASGVMSHLRDGQDLLFRLGGDEFCMLLFVDSAAMALSIIDRLRNQVRELDLPHPHGRDGVLTISCGVVWRDGHSATKVTSRELYIETDRVLYQAKRGGRDQTRMIAI